MDLYVKYSQKLVCLNEYLVTKSVHCIYRLYAWITGQHAIFCLCYNLYCIIWCALDWRLDWPWWAVYRKNINQAYREGGGDETCTQHCQAW